MDGTTDRFVQPREVCTILSSRSGYLTSLDAGEESSAHDHAADPGARGGWMPTYETGVMPDSRI